MPRRAIAAAARALSARRARLLVAIALAATLLCAAAAAAIFDLRPGGESRPTAAQRERPEPRLDGSGLPEAPAEAEGEQREGSPVVVQALPPGGVAEGDGAEEGPPRHIVEENARLRRELKHLKALEAERRRVARRLEAASVIYGGPLRFGSGNLVWPVNGPVVSPFGQRWGRLHAGIDIAAPAGTVIHAAQSGRVVISGPVGGYGNYVCVEHNARLTTCYAHLSRFMTRRGTVIRQGEPLGLVGCTGHCYGDHLHFETWVQGRPVDPMNYL